MIALGFVYMERIFSMLYFRYFLFCFIVIAIEAEAWDSSYYIWNFGLIAASDKGLNKNPQVYFATEHTFDKKAYQNIKSGDIVWLRCRFLSQFCKEVLPELKHPIILLIADGDESFPSECGKDFYLESLLNHELILHIFAQNYEYSELRKKISHIPIGMDFHTIAYNGNQGAWGEKGSPKEQEAQLVGILNNLKPTYLRKKGAFVDFQLSDTMHGENRRYLQFGEDRVAIFKRLLSTGLIDHDVWMRRSKLWERKGEYAFAISPHGNGLDCHRTWESLILGCIVIVKKSSLDQLYEGLPVVIINDWSEITSENLDKWLIQYGDAFTNQSYREKLTNQYWLSKIVAISNQIKLSK